MKFASFVAAVVASALVLGLVPAGAQDMTEIAMHDADTAPVVGATKA